MLHLSMQWQLFWIFLWELDPWLRDQTESILFGHSCLGIIWLRELQHGMDSLDLPGHFNLNSGHFPSPS